jgi:hypothetical protein
MAASRSYARMLWDDAKKSMTRENVVDTGLQSAALLGFAAIAYSENFPMASLSALLLVALGNAKAAFALASRSSLAERFSSVLGDTFPAKVVEVAVSTAEVAVMPLFPLRGRLPLSLRERLPACCCAPAVHANVAAKLNRKLQARSNKFLEVAV